MPSSLPDMRHPLTDVYAASRNQLIELGRTLSDEQASTMTTACPAWSVKDVYAHLAGISADILSNNTEGAATEPWADAQVAKRADLSLSEVLGEWAETGPQVSEVMDAFGDQFPFQLFIDQWTHVWDVRAALAPALGDAVAHSPDPAVMEFCLDNLGAAIETAGREAALPAITIDVDGREFTLGVGDSAGTLQLSLFEFGRIVMGRRSAAQLAALRWPVEDPEGYYQALVVWSVADRDVIDPVLAAT